MKPSCLVVLASLCTLAHAQQAPALPPASPVIAPPGVSVLRPEFARPDAPARERTVTDGTITENELRDLIRMQTEAIRVLSGKVDLLDDRLRRMESRMR
jgi:hypothetical protein